MFGPPQCNQFAFFFVVRNGERSDLVEIVRRGSRLDRWFFRRINNGGLAGYTSNALPRAEANARLAGRLLRHPRLWFEIPFFVLARALGEWRLGLRMLGSLFRGRLPRVHPFSVVVHHFMDEELLDTDEGKERLDACVFRLPVDGEMIPMCQFNGSTLRASLLQEAVQCE